MVLALLPTTAFTQTRKRSAGKSTSRPPAVKKTPEALQNGATHVADQIKALSRFLYLLGGVAKGIEAVDDAVRRNEASPAIVQQTQKNKASLKASLESVREGMDKLEIDFRTTPELQRYYIKLAGVASGAATAEQQAANNQFDQAGRSLLGVVNRLTDVLLEMR